MKIVKFNKSGESYLKDVRANKKFEAAGQPWAIYKGKVYHYVSGADTGYYFGSATNEGIIESFTNALDAYHGSKVKQWAKKLIDDWGENNYYQYFNKASGRTTRQIDAAIQGLFTNGWTHVWDHHNSKIAHERTFSIFMRRLAEEHSVFGLNVAKVVHNRDAAGYLAAFDKDDSVEAFYKEYPAKDYSVRWL